LDGIPLAIELAAARVRVLTPEQIDTRLTNRFQLLTGGSRTAPPRHQTLQALIDWSHDLLSESERALFRRLSVFAGGWTIEAAEAVCSGEPVAEAGVLDLLTGLVDKSLVMTDGQANGPMRYRLLESLRQFADERLAESRETQTYLERHAD
jgi:predicted ATPase